MVITAPVESIELKFWINWGFSWFIRQTTTAVCYFHIQPSRKFLHKKRCKRSAIQSQFRKKTCTQTSLGRATEIVNQPENFIAKERCSLGSSSGRHMLMCICAELLSPILEYRREWLWFSFKLCFLIKIFHDTFRIWKRTSNSEIAFLNAIFPNQQSENKLRHYHTIQHENKDGGHQSVKCSREAVMNQATYSSAYAHPLPLLALCSVDNSWPPLSFSSTSPPRFTIFPVSLLSFPSVIFSDDLMECIGFPSLSSLFWLCHLLLQLPPSFMKCKL